MSVIDVGKAKTFWSIHRFNDPDGEVAKLARMGHPIEELVKLFPSRFIGASEFEGNVFLNEGINLIWTLVCGGSGTPFDNANSYLGVGNGTDPEDATQTGLTGASKLYKGMDSGYPQFGSEQKAVWRATFNGNEANFAWQEFTVANGSSDTAINLNRKVSDQGTKVSGATWILTLTLKIS